MDNFVNISSKHVEAQLPLRRDDDRLEALHSAPQLFFDKNQGRFGIDDVRQAGRLCRSVEFGLAEIRFVEILHIRRNSIEVSGGEVVLIS